MRKRKSSDNVIISSIVVKRIGLLFPRAGDGKRNRQQGYSRNTFKETQAVNFQKKSKDHLIDQNDHNELISRHFPFWQIDRKMNKHSIESSFQLPTIYLKHEN